MQANSTGVSGRLQLDFIDGLRALAALYIVLSHALQASDYHPFWLNFAGYGHEVVVVFIAISGFCLGLPLARRKEWRLNTKQFFQKRARRILPPYYAALLIGILFIALSGKYGPPQDYLGNPFQWAMIWSHIALVQNWMFTQFGTVDGPLWSIAVECQIYILFPLFVLLRKKTGRWATILIWFLLDEILVITTPRNGCANFLFIFALGVLAAELAFSSKKQRWMPWIAVLCLPGIIFAQGVHQGLADIFTGIGIGLMMAHLTNSTGVAISILGWKPLAWMGTFSYSLYLVHSYVQVLPARWLFAHNPSWKTLSSAKQAAIQIFVFAPLAIVFSYGFHLIFERPFMASYRQRAERKLEPIAVRDAVTL
jgi:peptidoglycan/LPS O-acetylase OafA/YrhL